MLLVWQMFDCEDEQCRRVNSLSLDAQTSYMELQITVGLLHRRAGKQTGKTQRDRERERVCECGLYYLGKQLIYQMGQ